MFRMTSFKNKNMDYFLETSHFRSFTSFFRPVCDIGGADRHFGGPEWAAAGPGGPPGV